MPPLCPEDWIGRHLILAPVLFGKTVPGHPGHATRASAVAGGPAAQPLQIFFALLRALLGLNAR